MDWGRIGRCVAKIIGRQRLILELVAVNATGSEDLLSYGPKV